MSLVDRARAVVASGAFEKALLVFSGPSGAGKSTLLKRLFNDFPHTFGFSVSHTTRQPRPGETNGIEYEFVNVDQFEPLVKADAFLEYANFGGNWYGTSFAAVDRVTQSGRTCILDVDLAGVKSIKAHWDMHKASHGSIPARYIFVRPPAKEHLEQRLRSRGTETEEALQRRLTRVDADFEYAEGPGRYDLIVINDDLEAAYQGLVSFIFGVSRVQ